MGRTKCATQADLRRARGRLLVQVEGRYIALLEHGSELFAMDATCYHMGGPLLHADIEDMGEFGPAIVCPWHRYQISLRTGDGLYVNMAKQTCSKGARQRTHAVEVRDGDVFVTLDDSERKLESDTYAFKTPAPSGGMQQPTPHGRSGEVLRAGAAGLRAQPYGAAGAFGGGPLDASVASDVAKSMCGADGRAPWARGPSSCAGTPAVAKGGTLLGLHLPKLPIFGGRPAGASDGWARAVVAATRPVGKATVQLSVRGALPGADPSVWARGAHLMISLAPGGAERPYTPFVLPGGASGQFELVVKAYATGELSAALAALRPGGELRFKGPLSGSAGVRANAEAVGLVAGGTGITPMLQLLLALIQRAHAGGAPMPRVHVLCFNRTPEDILLREQLEQLCATNAQVRVEHCLTNPPKGWAGFAGRPSAQLLARALAVKPGPRAQLFYCGPPAFNATVRDALGALGFTDEMVHEFS